MSDEDDTSPRLPGLQQIAADGGSAQSEAEGLVQVVDGRPMIDSRDVAERFAKRHGNVLRQIKKLCDADEATELNFECCYYIGENGKQCPYMLMTRDGFTILAMGFTGSEAIAWKRRYIDAFNAMEERLRAPQIDLEDPSQLRHLLLGYAEKNQILVEKVEALKPAAEALERFEAAGGSQCITDVAKGLKERPKDLFAFMQAEKWIYRRMGGSWIGYQSKIQAGYLETVEYTASNSFGEERVHLQVRVTAKGISKLAQMLNERKKKLN